MCTQATAVFGLTMAIIPLLGCRNAGLPEKSVPNMTWRGEARVLSQSGRAATICIGSLSADSADLEMVEVDLAKCCSPVLTCAEHEVFQVQDYQPGTCILAQISCMTCQCF